MKKNNYFVGKKINNKIVYGFFSKQGGFSKNNYSFLNCSLSSSDNKTLVKKNINYAKKILNIKKHNLKFLKQIHSNKVSVIKENNLNKNFKSDGSITQNKNIALAILTADCAPIFIFDQNSTFICALHAGWKGSLNNIIQSAIKKILKKGIDPFNLIAIVGPCLAKNNFEVDSKLKNLFLKQDSKYKIYFNKKSKNNKFKFDMRGLINFQLKKCLVRKIVNINLDTYANSNKFYSHRRSTHENTLPTGRMINIIAFK